MCSFHATRRFSEITHYLRKSWKTLLIWAAEDRGLEARCQLAPRLQSVSGCGQRPAAAWFATCVADRTVLYTAAYRIDPVKAKFAGCPGHPETVSYPTRK